MALNPETVGLTSQGFVYEYDWHEAVLYALGVGAKSTELDFLFEGRGPRVLPTFGVVPAFPAVASLFAKVGGDLRGVVHGAQKITLSRPFEPSGRLTTLGRVKGIYDLKRWAQVVFSTETHALNGDLVCTTEWTVIYRFDGGFGGEPPPKTERIHLPTRAPDFVVEDSTTSEQALLYRLNGDFNPLHADPVVAAAAGFERPILHGLCTYGSMARALLQRICDGEPMRLLSFSAQFRKPIFPGETIVTEGWREDRSVLLRASTKERLGEYVVNQAYAEIE